MRTFYKNVLQALTTILISGLMFGLMFGLILGLQLGLFQSLLIGATYAQTTEGALRVPPLPPLPKGPVPTHMVIRAVAHGALALGKEVGGARITISDAKTGLLLATGLQQGEAGDQNQIMRTPHIMEEQVYASNASASFQTTLQLEKPTWVDITATGPLAYPSAVTQTTKKVLLIPGQDLRSEGIILDLSGYIVEIKHPLEGEALIGKDDVKLVASIRTLSGTHVRPYGDWDSRKIQIWGEILIGDRIVERLQMFYTGEQSMFSAPFFVPVPSEAPDGITLRVMASDGAKGNFGLGQTQYPVRPEQAPLRKK